MTNNKILIVDDNPEIREVLNVLLSSEGYDVIEAKDGQEAIDMVSDDIDLYSRYYDAYNQWLPSLC